MSYFRVDTPGEAPIPPTFLYDFTSQQTSYAGVTYTRTGSTIYAMNGQNAAQAFAANVPVWEDQGNGLGGGLLTFQPKTNVVESPAAWGSVAGFSPSPLVATVNGPDGSVATAYPAYGAAGQNSFGGQGSVSPANARWSLWAKPDPTTPATVPGAFTISNGYQGLNFSTLPAWRRYTMACSGGDYTLWPKGCTANTTSIEVGQSPPTLTPAASGGVDVWGPQAIGDTSLEDVPTLPIGGSSGAAVLELVDTDFAPGGNLDVTFRFSSLYDDSTSGASVPLTAPGYAWSFSDASGLFALQWSPGASQWTFTARGAVVLTTPGCFVDGETAVGGYQSDDEIEVRVWYKPTSGVCGMRVKVNGARIADTTGVASGAGVAPTSSFYLGSNLGSSSATFPAKWMQGGPSLTTSTSQLGCEFVYVGDSTQAAYGGVLLEGAAGVYGSQAEWRARPGILSLAAVGDTCAAQQATWLASSAAGDPAVTCVIVRAGNGDLFNGSTAAQALAACQTLINTILGTNPTAKILLQKLSPVGTTGPYAPYYTEWLAFNAAAPSTLTGYTRYSTTASDSVNDGMGNIPVGYRLNGTDTGHCNNAGKMQMGAADRADLIAMGLLS